MLSVSLWLSSAHLVFRLLIDGFDRIYVPHLIAHNELSRFLTYFPHVDNIYSHRSTQKYKRKPFISHYWDCRLKGRPPGTPKSDDPNKKKRKRQARERDLCDVKIKITEYFPGARAQLGSDFVGRSTETAGNENNYFAPGQPGAIMNNTQQTQSFSAIGNNGTYRPDPPGSDGSRFYTIQRVNGNGANGKSDAISGTHKHSLDDSDRVKKNSIQRHFLKEEKLKRRSQVSKSKFSGFVAQSSKTLRKHACHASQPSLLERWKILLRGCGGAHQTEIVALGKTTHTRVIAVPTSGEIYKDDV